MTNTVSYSTVHIQDKMKKYLRQDEFLGHDEYEFQGKMNKVFFTKYIRSSRNNKVLRGT